MNSLSHETEIISLIQSGNVDQVIPAIERALQDHETLDFPALFRASIKSMQLDVLQSLLDRFISRDGDDDRSANDKKSLLEIIDRSVILEAITPGRLSTFKLLCDYYPSLRTIGMGHNGPPLAWAVIQNNLPLASFLLASGVDPNESPFNHRPLLEAAAAIKQGCDMMNLLLDHGAVFEGTETIFTAVYFQRIDILTLLLKTRKVADINAIQPIRDKRDLTPGPVLHLAVRRKYKKMVHVLTTQFHADPLVQDMEGRTALSWAEEVKDPDILRSCLLGCGRARKAANIGMLCCLAFPCFLRAKPLPKASTG